MPDDDEPLDEAERELREVMTEAELQFLVDDRSELDKHLDSIQTGRGLGYYDRDGQRVSLRRWAQICENDEYRRVGSDYLFGGALWVSTVLIGLDHNFTFQGPPLIFETMAFSQVSEEESERKRAEAIANGWPYVDFPWEEVVQERYSTEDEAREGHRRIVDGLRLREEELREIMERAEKDH